MAGKMPSIGLLVLQRLLRGGKSSPGHSNCTDVYQHILRRSVRTTPRWNDEKGDVPQNTDTSGYRSLSRRRSLCPLERISTLLPENIPSESDLEQDPEPEPPGETPTSLPGERLLSIGELLIVERWKRSCEYQKMFKLKTGGRLNSSWGFICHDDIIGQSAGSFFTSNLGIKIFIRRVALEEYVMFMKKAPVISYPKDMASMLLMMDVTEGDHVLDAGSGSGAMSLFLSRAVGSKGRVVSVEVREDHHKRAVSNYSKWRTAWQLRRGVDWPDNVQYHLADLRNSSALLAAHGFNSVALDMIQPQLVLGTVIHHLHPGGVCSVYLCNITQVIELLEGIRCEQLPLQCEQIIEVPVRDWLVAPAIRQKDGKTHCRESPALEEAENEMEVDKSKEVVNAPFGSVLYVARPHSVQRTHTAFLVKLRRYCS